MRRKRQREAAAALECAMCVGNRQLLAAIQQDMTALRKAVTGEQRPTGFIELPGLLSDTEYQELSERFRKAVSDPSAHGLRLLPPDAVMIRRRAPEERHRYLTEHRDEAVSQGIPTDLIDLLIAEAEVGHE